ncbi:hypothetical protein CRG98_023391 [Punica granatum]|uniref:Uncharacterized protein n=1 Tax=Punica granatum TaxID=22663 RepID=A0A2I0JKX0_PUNGR|nr:hypothetical protein CRG98_023391 [Punica granatum]
MDVRIIGGGEIDLAGQRMEKTDMDEASNERGEDRVTVCAWDVGQRAQCPDRTSRPEQDKSLRDTTIYVRTRVHQLPRGPHKTRPL